jgi:hypothetical protein
MKSADYVQSTTHNYFSDAKNWEERQWNEMEEGFIDDDEATLY